MLPHNAIAKTHPASREVTPDDPLSLHAVEIPGDPELMLRLLVEEYARLGWGAEAILRLARDPNYQAFHGLWRRYGEAELRRRVEAFVARCGVLRIRTVEVEPVEEEIEPLLHIKPRQTPPGPRSDLSDSSRR